MLRAGGGRAGRRREPETRGEERLAPRLDSSAFLLVFKCEESLGASFAHILK